MKYWALERKKQKKRREVVFEASLPKEWTIQSLTDLLTFPCEKMDISRPIILEKHLLEWERIGRVVFRAIDFIDAVPFDTFELEMIDEEKNRKKEEDRWGDND